MTAQLLANLVAISSMHSMVWLLSLWRRDVSIVDIFWGLGFVLIAWRTTLGQSEPTPLDWLLLAMVTLWGLRLSTYLAWRNLRKPEDARYAAMRQRGGKWFPISSLFVVFLLQAVLTWIVALPVQVGMHLGGEIGVPAIIGLILWGGGLAFETLGDAQLARFKADPRNRGGIMDRGLWRYTRHPNYFGDFLVWWGIYVSSTQAGVVWWTVMGPLLMSFLLIRVSGARLLDRLLSARLEGYDEYVNRTNTFFPWFPRSPR